LDALTQMVSRVGGVARRLARLVGRAAVAGGVAGLVLWWGTAGDRVDGWWRGTARSLLVLALCVAPAAWLANVRFALMELVELPDKLGGVASRRTAQLLGDDTPIVRPDDGLVPAIRSVREVVRDYGDVVGSWGAVAQLLAPSFWVLTGAALLAVPIVALLAAVVSLAGLHGG